MIECSSASIVKKAFGSCIVFLRDPAAVGYIDRECLYGLIAYAFDISFTYVQISLRCFGLFVVSSFDLSATVDDQSLEY